MKKYNKLYSNGCSYMWGHGHNNADIFHLFDETKNIDTSEKMVYEKNSFFNNYDWVRKKFQYPKLVANHFDLELIDESIYGGSFQRVFRKTMQYILKENDISDTIFLLEWPNGSRSEFWSNTSKRFINLTAMRDNFDNVDFDDFGQAGNWYYRFYDPNIFQINEIFMGLTLKNYIESLGGLVVFCLCDNLEFCFKHDTKNVVSKYINEDDLHEKLEKEIYTNCVLFEKGLNKNYNLIYYYLHLEKSAFKYDTNGIFKDEHNSFRGSRLIADNIIKHIENVTN